ncbi:MAG: 2-amino-4-hydroxy-6-hydroxymethyldihydropteridine diphosphokinase [Congregibacter sp.]
MRRCYVGLGANLDQPLFQLHAAANALEIMTGNQPAGRSAIYRSHPLGGPDGQPDYLNAVLALDTTLTPLSMLDQLQIIEQAAGRVRDVRWAARTLDLDLLLFGDTCMQHKRLTLPHPRIYERNFVLYPLSDLLPESWTFPDHSSLEQRLAACPDNPLQVIENGWSLPGADAKRLLA